MANRPAIVTKMEVARSIAAAMSAGLKIGRVEVDHRQGLVVIVPEGRTDDSSGNPCDRLLKK
jgi:hypothetical protein